MSNEDITKTISTSEDEEELNCPICLELICEPITLSCGHTYCEHCISQWIASHTLSKLCSLH